MARQVRQSRPQLVCVVADNSGAIAGKFLSTWKYILRTRGLFQTTLTPAWLDRDFLRIATVGDAGACGAGIARRRPGRRRIISWPNAIWIANTSTPRGRPTAARESWIAGGRSS
jgi:hypothetical protein